MRGQTRFRSGTHSKRENSFHPEWFHNDSGYVGQDEATDGKCLNEGEFVFLRKASFGVCMSNIQLTPYLFIS